jgi:hypothetical protein
MGGLRNRNIVIYDDGMMEKQFVRMMEKQFDAEEEQRISKKRKATKMQESSQDLTSARVVQPQEASARPDTMTEWTFRFAADIYLVTCKSSVMTGNCCLRMQESSTVRDPGLLWMLAPWKKN